MAPVKVNARDYIVQVLAADATTWLEIANLNTITPNYAEGEETVDTGVITSGGNAESEIMQRGRALTLEGFETKDRITGAPDPGQARCLALANATSYDSLGVIRLRAVMDTEWERWNATFSVGEKGGDKNAKSGFSCTITRSGASSTMAVS